MTRIRRIAALIGLALAAVVATTAPAWADFSDTPAPITTSITSATVAAPAGVTVQTSCTLTTTTSSVTKDPTTGATTSSSTSSTSGPTRTIVSDQTTTVNGTTTTTVTRSTSAAVLVTWQASASRGVTGYGLVARMAGTAYDMGSTTALSMFGQVDATYLNLGITITVRTLTSYGWTADSAAKGPLTC
jgi:hypothetical protein